MKTLASLNIQPRVFNTPIPWASNLELLRKLYECPHTGAITTRTSMLNGFPDNPAVNQYVLFNPSTQQAASVSQTDDVVPAQNASLNTIVFSPFTLDQFLGFVKALSDEAPADKSLKPVIVSITGTAEEVAIGYGKVNDFQTQVRMELAVEVNLSCPNVPGKASPAYDGESLMEYLVAIKNEADRQRQTSTYNGLPIGVKFPPFTYQDQYDVIIDTLVKATEQNDDICPIGFITSTNTLGSALVVNGENGESVLKSIAGTGIGGMAGAPIHALSLGNVLTIRQMLNAQPKLKHLEIIGVGGVDDKGGYDRMRSVGADFVGVGTAIGVKGLQVFADIAG